MAAPNMNGRLHLTDVHQNSPASLEKETWKVFNHFLSGYQQIVSFLKHFIVAMRE